jgi:predicted regulator of Ras-like GTPase activity (Roadblock/LC7/MglB family)
MSTGLERRVTNLLAAGNADGGFPMSLVCTEQGLLIAAAGDPAPCEILAALASILDDVMQRAARDLGMGAVDELTIKDAARGRFVLRPLPPTARARLFLVVQVPATLPWRRATNRLAARLQAELADFCAEGPDGD